MTIIAPSILAADFLNIEQELKRLEGINNLWLHLDVMDGHFVPNLTFGHPIIKKIAEKTKIPLDAHCMVSNPKFYIETFKSFNLTNITFHLEADHRPFDLIKEAKKYFPHVGISIKPQTPITALSDEMLKSIDLILLMSVDPGFGGQKFMPDSIDRLSKLNQLKKDKNYRYMIQVDGGINDKNASELINLGAQNLVAGSYIFGNQKDYKKQIESLRL